MAAGQDDARSSKYLFAPLGLIVLHPFEVDGLKNERALAERPDRTRRVTDQPTAQDFSATWKLRDKVEVAALKAWQGSRAHVPCTVTYLTEGGEVVSVAELQAVCPRGYETTKLSTKDDAEEVTIKFNFTADDYNLIA